MILALKKKKKILLVLKFTKLQKKSFCTTDGSQSHFPLQRLLTCVRTSEGVPKPICPPLEVFPGEGRQ